MTNYVKLLNNLEKLKLTKIKENLQLCTITPKPLEFYKERLGGKYGDN